MGCGSSAAKGVAAAADEGRGAAVTAAQKQRAPAVFDEDDEAIAADDKFELPVHQKSPELMKLIEEACASSTVFTQNVAEEAHRKQIILAMERVSARAGDIILQQGQLGDKYYVVESGEFEVLDEKGVETVERFKGSGSFGELALLYRMPCSSTVRCSAGGSLWALDRRTFRRTLMMHNMLSIGETDRFLKAVEILSSLTDQQRLKIAGALEEISYEDGQILWDVGDAADWLCLIREGTVVSTSSYREPLRFTAGSFFGTQALKSDANTKRIARVVAEGGVTAYKLTRQAVNELLGDLGALIKRNMTMKQIPAIQLFKSLSPAEIEVLVDSAYDSTFAEGESIIKQGEVKSLVYVIKDGKAARDGDTLETGAYFGEEAFTQTKQKYASTVVAKEPLTCLTINCQQFKSSATVQIAETLRNAASTTNSRMSTVASAMPSFDDLVVLKLLGVGSFGRVRLVRHEASSSYFALKCMNKGLIIARKQVQHVANEKHILSTCVHPFLVQLKGWYQNPYELYMLFELVLGGELFSILSKSIFTEDTCRFYTANVASAFEYLHEKKIAYRDLKPENLLLDEKGYLKVADFGFAKVIKDRTWTLCGTPDYLAPETITCKGHDCAVDWWALGILLHELLTGFPPFAADDQVETFKRILTAKLSYPPSIGKTGCEVMTRLLTVNPTLRLGANGGREVREHIFFEPLDFVRLIGRQLPTPYVPTIKSPADTSNYEHFEEPDLQQWDGHNTDDAKTFSFWDTY